jgi:dihydrofolate reductase
MPKLRVHSFAMSVDGFVAGPNQDLDNPLGVGGEQLHTWAFGDRHPVDDYFFARGGIGIGATVMGRNMFGPIRGEWGDSDWTGWWGAEPPYHHPVFVVTHHAHDPIEMKGGTTFTFVTDGIESALAQSFAAADGQDVRLGGGASTVRQCLELDLVDELHLAIVPVLLGSGERLFDGLDVADRYERAEIASSPVVAHVVLTRVAG